MNIEIGKIVGVWGVKGWIKLHSYTRERNDISCYKHWFIGTPKRAGESQNLNSVEVSECRSQGRGMVAKLKNIDTREQAENLIGNTILVHRSQLPELPEGEYYWQDLIGLQVKNSEQIVLGTVVRLIETGANDVLVIQPPVDAEQQEVLIPYHDEFVLQIDTARSEMLVAWDPNDLID